MNNKKSKKFLNYNLKAILNYIKKENITKPEFCKRCGISLYSLNKILNYNLVKVEVCCKIIKLLNITLDCFLNINKK